MSGRLQLSGWPAAPSAWGRLTAPGRDGEKARLIAALALSCLLHASPLLLPLLGMRLPDYRVVVKGEQTGPYVVNATLVLKDAAHLFSGLPVPTAGEDVPNTSVSALGAGERIRPEDPAASGIGLLPIRGQAYYTTDQLTKRPQPLAKAELDPDEVKPIVASGRIVLKLWINGRGSVDKVEVESSTLPGLMAQAAVDGFKRLHFAPGERDGQAVGTVMRVEVTYQDGRELHR
jgi:TonB family protein